MDERGGGRSPVDPLGRQIAEASDAAPPGVELRLTMRGGRLLGPGEDASAPAPPPPQVSDAQWLPQRLAEFLGAQGR